MQTAAPLRQPESGSGEAAGGLCPVEAIEDERQVLVADAGPVVAHDHLAGGHGDLDRRMGRAPLLRVVEQVRDGAVVAQEALAVLSGHPAARRRHLDVGVQALLSRRALELRALATRMNRPNRALKATITGYRTANPAERAGFGMLSACAVTIAVARAITYRMERDRSAPRLRSWARRAEQSVGGQELRVHHFVPGIGLTVAAGATAILTRTDGYEFALSVPLGTGAGLVLDEVGLLLKADNPYWSTQTLALAEGGVAALAAAALAVRFHRRGSARLDRLVPAGESAVESDLPAFARISRAAADDPA